MPNSLNAGPQLKKSRGAKFLEQLAGSLTTFRVGSRLIIEPAELPATCTVGEIAVSDSNELNICTAADTWTVVGTQS